MPDIELDDDDAFELALANILAQVMRKWTDNKDLIMGVVAREILGQVLVEQLPEQRNLMPEVRAFQARVAETLRDHVDPVNLVGQPPAIPLCGWEHPDKPGLFCTVHLDTPHRYHAGPGSQGIQWLNTEQRAGM